jgi:Xaa-Pro aminopeptidase
MPLSLAEQLKIRRQRLAKLVDVPALLWSGRSQSRNFPANTFPFRASSHFLYFAGLPLENAAIHLEMGRLTLFMDDPSPASALWHGTPLTRAQVAAELGADAAYPLAALNSYGADAATIAAPDQATQLVQSRVLDRLITPAHQPQGVDLALAQAVIALRLVHDELALEEIRKAIAVTLTAHRIGMAMSQTAKLEAGIRAAMESVIISNNMTCAYSSIVTVQGAVLHNNHYGNRVREGHLLLADVGAETASGWAADVTRTWPIADKFSATQRAIYDLVLTAHDAAIAAIRPHVEYRDIHLLACLTLTQGLVELGILQGNPQELVDRDTHALFFPHGIGHLLGLDVHDMEDLGDLAGYAPGRTRSTRFGLGYLRLDRPLQAGMVVTIEPGFYQVPAILQDPERRATYKDCVNWERLAQFADVCGIRIEDDVLVTATGAEVLTAALPTQAEEIEQAVTG